MARAPDAYPMIEAAEGHVDGDDGPMTLEFLHRLNPLHWYHPSCACYMRQYRGGDALAIG